MSGFFPCVLAFTCPDLWQALGKAQNFYGLKNFINMSYQRDDSYQKCMTSLRPTGKTNTYFDGTNRTVMPYRDLKMYSSKCPMYTQN